VANKSRSIAAQSLTRFAYHTLRLHPRKCLQYEQLQLQAQLQWQLMTLYCICFRLVAQYRALLVEAITTIANHYEDLEATTRTISGVVNPIHSRICAELALIPTITSNNDALEQSIGSLDTELRLLVVICKALDRPDDGSPLYMLLSNILDVLSQIINTMLGSCATCGSSVDTVFHV
jgi:hypothetical protein